VAGHRFDEESGVISRLLAGPGRRDRLTHLEYLPARVGTHATWPDWASPHVVAAFQGKDITEPWLHQVEAADHAHAGRNVVIATGTASGKSIGYLLPTLTSIEQRRRAHHRRGATALYIAPTKALAHDQLTTLWDLDLPHLRATTHDGDSSSEQRAWARDHAEYVLTNPDMLHHSLLPQHRRWSQFFGQLQYVVVDECHHYRGVFGSHVASILRRLRRVAALYGAEPTFVLASATAAEPVLAAERLTGLPFVAVTEDTSARGAVSLALWEPPFTSYSGENGAPVRRSAAAEAADLLADLVIEDVRTLAFVRSRRGAETVALTARSHLEDVAPGLGGRVAAYRGGYLPEERRELEAQLRSGAITGLATTNALELGIDIAGLDAVLLAGFPGTRAGLWQQLGRAGRSGNEALGVLIARDDPLDTYLVTHPDALIKAPLETFVFDPANPYVLGPHLCAAAAESPLTESDFTLFGPTTSDAVTALTEAGLLRRRAGGWYWTDRRRASDLTDIRGTGGEPVRIVDPATGRLLGTTDRGSAPSTLHTGAVYVHQGESYLVDELDLDGSVALVRHADPDYSTTARTITDIGILDTIEEQGWGANVLCFGTVRVTHQVVSYLKRRVPTGEVLGEVPLDLPEQVLETKAVWWILDDSVIAASQIATADLAGAAHAAEHAAIGMLPLFATCDRWDIGGVSTALHPDTEKLTVFVYDGHPGGAGFAERGFATADTWLAATREAIASCRCEDGCPSCVQSPKCGNGNNPLAKAEAITLLDLLLVGAPR
jgi:DEAD/DEAH box helicase domain-containing protein